MSRRNFLKQGGALAPATLTSELITKYVVENAKKIGSKMCFIFRVTFLIIAFILNPELTNSQTTSQTIKWDCSAVIYIDHETVYAENRYGNIIKQGKTGKADADVIQSAIELASPTGEIKICRGKYILDNSILICHNIKLVGEGRGTVIVPPINDYAFKVEKREKEIIPRPYHAREDHPLYAVVIRDLTIDGERQDLKHSGKGIFLKVFWSSIFENLWIQNTGNALTLQSVKESDFSNIYLINNGDEKNREPSLLIRGGNNLHVSGLYVIYQNYIGLEMLRGKLVFITQSMFHGWLPRHGGPAKFPLIQIKDLNNDRNNEGRYKSDFVIENSRITVSGEGTSAVNIINSPVTIRQCVATSGFANTVISATKNARVNISDNSFYSLKTLPMGTYALYAEDAEVIFKNNVVSCQNLQLCLKAARNSIIADNRFDAISELPNIIIGETEDKASRSIQVKGNIFRKEELEDAVVVSANSKKNISIYNNQLWSE